MLSVLGYVINSIILLIVVVVIARIYVNLKGADTSSSPMGPLVKEISDIIIENGRKFFPVKEETTLLYVIIAVLIVLFFIVRAVLI